MAESYFWQRWPQSLRWAVGASLLFHVCVLLPVGLLRSPVAMPPAPFAAVLKGPGDVSHAAPEEAPRAKSVSAGETARQEHKTLKPPVQQQRPDATANAATKATSQITGTTQGDTSTPANTASKAGSTGGAPESARSGIEADALTRYRLALGREAQKARRYPGVSQIRGQEGTCEVLVVLTRGGATPTVALGKTSGSDALDDGALRMARIAVAHTPVPSELQGHDSRIPLNIRFTLNDS